MLIVLVGIIATAAVAGGATSQQAPAEAAYYGNVTIAETGEPPEEPIIVQGAIERNVSGSIEVGTELPYNMGGPAIADEKLTVSPPEDGDGVTQFIVAGEVVETVEFEGFINNIDLTVPQAVVDPSFSITATDSPETVGVDTTFNLEVGVENTGAYSGTQEVSVAVNGATRVTEEVTLDGQQTQNLSLTVPTEQGDRGNASITVASEDDTETVSVDVIEPTSAVEIIGTNAGSDQSVTQGEQLVVTAEVRETTAVGLTQTVELREFGGSTVDSAEVTVDPGGAQTVDLRWTPVGTDIGEGEVTVVSPDSEDTVPITVEGGEQPPSPPGGGGTGGGGAGGGGEEPTEPAELPGVGSVLELPTDTAPADSSVRRIAPTGETTGETTGAVVRFDNSSPINFIFWEQISQDVINTTAAVAAFNQTPAGIDPLPGEGLTTAQVGFNSSVAADAPASVNVQISQEQLSQAGIQSLSDLQIAQYDQAAERWVPRETFVVDRTESTVTLAAEVPGFSFVGVSAITAPAVDVEADSSPLVVGEEVTFTAVLPTDEAEISTYQWEVGDQQLTGRNVTVPVPEGETVAVSLSIETASGATSTVTREFSPVQPAAPELTLTTPDTIETGATGAVNITVTNPGEIAAEQTLSLAVDGTTELSEQLSLGRNETTTRSVEITAPNELAEISIVAAFGEISQEASLTVELRDEIRSERAALEERISEVETQIAELNQRDAPEIAEEIETVTQDLSELSAAVGNVVTEEDVTEIEQDIEEVAERVNALGDQIENGATDDQAVSDGGGGSGPPWALIGAGVILVVLVVGAALLYRRRES